MNPSRNLLWLVRREVWEHRSLWIAPVVMAGVILIVTLLGGVHFNDHGSFWVGTTDGNGPDLRALSPEDRERALEAMTPKNKSIMDAVVLGVYSGITITMFVVLGIVVFFYLLDTLLAERRDRSILFWKSLPVSDGEVVTSKALTALVVAPAFVTLLSAVLLVLFAAAASLRLAQLPVSPWSARIWFDLQVIMLGFVPMIVLWYLPIAGYLLVVSVWARKNAFLWAVLPWAALLLIEGMITQTTNVARFLGDRFAGFARIIGDNPHIDIDADNGIATVYGLMGRVYGDYHIWVGAIAGLALIYAAVRIRRFRDDS